MGDKDREQRDRDRATARGFAAEVRAAHKDPAVRDGRPIAMPEQQFKDAVGALDRLREEGKKNG